MKASILLKEKEAEEAKRQTFWQLKSFFNDSNFR